MKSVPCATCPWRKSSTAGGADIPGFSIELMRRLSNTVGEGDAFRPVMACHGSACGAEEPCVGYVAVEGYSNLAVRVMVVKGKVSFQAIDAAVADIELWPSSTRCSPPTRRPTMPRDRRPTLGRCPRCTGRLVDEGTGEWVICASCGDEWPPEVLDDEPEAEAEPWPAPTHVIVYIDRSDQAERA